MIEKPRSLTNLVNVVLNGIQVVAACVLLIGCAARSEFAPLPTPDKDTHMEISLATLPDLGEAPELKNEIWLNTPQPLRLADLRGQVVLLEMWTFGCINCQHVIPKLREWHETYADQGLVIIGNHYPEFSYEEKLENLKTAVADLEIKYAVAQDNEGQTWRAYQNHYWPALFLIDKDGRIRYQHIGEGAYSQTEAAIKQLLAEAP